MSEEIQFGGFIPEEPKPEDWVFGADEKEKRVYMPTGHGWGEYSPSFENQRASVESWMCVAFSFCDAVSYPMNFRLLNGEVGDSEFDWLDDNGFINDQGKFDASQLLLAIISNTVKGKGTSFSNVAETAHKIGLVGEKVYPYKYDAESWEELAAKDFDDTVMARANEFLDRYEVTHKWVVSWPNEPVASKIEKYKEALKYGTLWVGIYAFPAKDSEGRYVYSSNTPNHASGIYDYEDGVEWLGDDSYLVNGSNFKKYAWNFNIAYAKQVYITYKLEEDDDAIDMQLYNRAKNEGSLIFITEGGNGEMYKFDGDEVKYLSSQRQSNGHVPLFDEMVTRLNNYPGEIIPITKDQFHYTFEPSLASEEEELGVIQKLLKLIGFYK